MKLPATTLQTAMLRRCISEQDLRKFFGNKRATVVRWMKDGVPKEHSHAVAVALDEIENKKFDGARNVDLFEKRKDDGIYAWLTDYEERHP